VAEDDDMPDLTIDVRNMPAKFRNSFPAGRSDNRQRLQQLLHQEGARAVLRQQP
jgi:hypothetical protein